MKSRFACVNRGFRKNILLITGWASDYRIFNALELNYNYIFPVELNPFDFLNSLADFLKTSAVERLACLGWSLGAFLAADFAAQNPDRIEEVILLNIRKNYQREDLEAIGSKLRKNKQAYLYKFYRDCFSPEDKAGWRWFRENLLHDYSTGIRLEELLLGLEYLANAKIEPAKLRGVNRIRIFHGVKDKIAPFNEAEAFAAGLRQAEFVRIPDAGHLLFFNRDFKTRLNE